MRLGPFLPERSPSLRELWIGRLGLGDPEMRLECGMKTGRMVGLFGRIVRRSLELVVVRE